MIKEVKKLLKKYATKTDLKKFENTVSSLVS